MKKSSFLLLSLIFLSINIISCAQEKENPSMSISELKEEIKTNKNLVILDVRTEEELKGPLGHIEGVVHIPVQELKSRISELDKYSDKEIAVICRTGNRSGVATQILRLNGFDAKNVLGGMVEYRRSEK